MSIRKKLSQVHIQPRAVYLIPFVLIALSLACAMPDIGGPTPTPPAPTLEPTVPATPTPTPLPLPPDLVESQPIVGGEVPLEGPITLYFNQPMDKTSVEFALTSQLKQDINFTWLDDYTVVL